MGRDRRQRRRRVAAVGGAAMAAKKHRDAKQTPQESGRQLHSSPRRSSPPRLAD